MAEFISKNRIFDLIHAVYSVHGFTSYEDYVGLLKDVETSTNADVRVVKHGRWENEYLEDDDVWWADCTNCKNDSHSRFGRVSIYAYCPNCGAKMIKDGEQND